MVRKLLVNLEMYERISDYWVNDLDDGFVLLLMLNCFKHTSLTNQENSMKEKLEGIISNVFRIQ